MKIRVGIAGAGAIASEIAGGLLSGRIDSRLILAGLYEVDAERQSAFGRKHPKARFFSDLKKLLGACDVLVEATSARAAYAVCCQALAARRPVLALSAAGLFEYWSDLDRRARDAGVWVRIPSGAIGGLDAIRAAACADLRSVTLSTRKPPKALAGAPYLVRKKIDLSGIRREKLVFEGTARQAAKAFPQNINIAATLAAAGTGIQKTRVRIWAVPGLTRNVHEVEAIGDFGRFTAKIENNPSPDNPKTSRLAALSALACLRQLSSGLRIGS